ncbi:MAG TPA: YggT family protein, partial [Patescibacteria group bacterium]|nr:YggT family protein [Patescibacteria group bacterium]
IFGLIEFFLGLRIILEFFDANAGAPFVSWIYGTSGLFLGPFRNIFPFLNLGGFIVDLTAIAALIVYAIIANLILSLFSSRYAY